MTCDKCHKEIQEHEERYTAMEPKAFRHATCHYPPPRSIPPAEDSIRECIKKGLLASDADGRLIPGSKVPKIKVGWGAYELIELVEALWPGIPPAGVPWNDVVARAKRANAALNMIDAQVPKAV